MKKQTKIVVFLLCMVLMCAMLSLCAFATTAEDADYKVEINGETTYYADADGNMADKFRGADNANVTLLKDMTTKGLNVAQFSHGCVIDLNGKTLDLTTGPNDVDFILYGGADVTIKNGTLVLHPKHYSFAFKPAADTVAKLTFDGVTISCDGASDWADGRGVTAKQNCGDAILTLKDTKLTASINLLSFNMDTAIDKDGTGNDGKTTVNVSGTSEISCKNFVGINGTYLNQCATYHVDKGYFPKTAELDVHLNDAKLTTTGYLFRGTTAAAPDGSGNRFSYEGKVSFHANDCWMQIGGRAFDTTVAPSAEINFDVRNTTLRAMTPYWFNPGNNGWKTNGLDFWDCDVYVNNGRDGDPQTGNGNYIANCNAGSGPNFDTCFNFHGGSISSNTEWGYNYRSYLDPYVDENGVDHPVYMQFRYDSDCFTTTNINKQAGDCVRIRRGVVVANDGKNPDYPVDQFPYMNIRYIDVATNDELTAALNNIKNKKLDGYSSISTDYSADIRISADLTMTSNLYLSGQGQTVSIYLNGHTISYAATDVNNRMFRVGGKNTRLNVYGPGTLDCSANEMSGTLHVCDYSSACVHLENLTVKSAATKTAVFYCPEGITELKDVTIELTKTFGNHIMGSYHDRTKDFAPRWTLDNVNIVDNSAPTSHILFFENYRDNTPEFGAGCENKDLVITIRNCDALVYDMILYGNANKNHIVDLIIEDDSLVGCRAYNAPFNLPAGSTLNLGEYTDFKLAEGAIMIAKASERTTKGIADITGWKVNCFAVDACGVLFALDYAENGTKVTLTGDVEITDANVDADYAKYWMNGGANNTFITNLNPRFGRNSKNMTLDLGGHTITARKFTPEGQPYLFYNYNRASFLTVVGKGTINLFDTGLYYMANDGDKVVDNVGFKMIGDEPGAITVNADFNNPSGTGYLISQLTFGHFDLKNVNLNLISSSVNKFVAFALTTRGTTTTNVYTNFENVVINANNESNFFQGLTGGSDKYHFVMKNVTYNNNRPMFRPDAGTINESSVFDIVIDGGFMNSTTNDLVYYGGKSLGGGITVKAGTQLSHIFGCINKTMWLEEGCGLKITKDGIFVAKDVESMRFVRDTLVNGVVLKVGYDDVDTALAGLADGDTLTFAAPADESDFVFSEKTWNVPAGNITVDLNGSYVSAADLLLNVEEASVLTIKGGVDGILSCDVKLLALNNADAVINFIGEDPDNVFTLGTDADTGLIEIIAGTVNFENVSIEAVQYVGEGDDVEEVPVAKELVLLGVGYHAIESWYNGDVLEDILALPAPALKANLTLYSNIAYNIYVSAQDYARITAAKYVKGEIEYPLVFAAMGDEYYVASIEFGAAFIADKFNVEITADEETYVWEDLSVLAYASAMMETVDDAEKTAIASMVAYAKVVAGLLGEVPADLSAFDTELAKIDAVEIVAGETAEGIEATYAIGTEAGLRLHATEGIYTITFNGEEITHDFAEDNDVVIIIRAYHMGDDVVVSDGENEYGYNIANFAEGDLATAAANYAAAAAALAD